MARVVGARRSGLLLGVLVLLHVIAISHQVDGGGGISLLERVVLSALSPFQRATAGTLYGVTGLWNGYVDLRRVYEENAALRERAGRLELLVRQLQVKAHQAERLREVLDLRELLPHDSVAAEVIARDGVPWFRTLTLDKGTEAGVRLNAPVIDPTGVVGRVVAVGAHVARVQLLWDRDSGVGGRIERTRVTGIVSGEVGLRDAERTELVMRYVPLHADVESGDVVVTSGLDRIFPKGLVVGRVLSILRSDTMFKQVLVSPAARFDLVEEVLVIRPAPELPPLTETVE